MTCFRMEDGKTLRKYCIEKGIKYNNVYKRLDAGLSVEESIRDCLMPSWKRKITNCKYAYDGKSLLEYCNDNNLSYTKVVYLIIKGETVKNAIKKVVKYKKDKRYNNCKYFYDGCTLKEYCEKKSLRYGRVYYFIKLGKTVEESVKIAENELTEKFKRYRVK